MSEPAETPDRNTGVELARQASDPGVAAAGMKLAQQIRFRYGQSPGVIRTDVTMGLARRISRLTPGPSPLLAVLSRRWSSARAVFPGSHAALVHDGRVVSRSRLTQPAEQQMLRRSGVRQPVGAAGSLPVVARLSAGPAAAAGADVSEPRPAAGEAGVLPLSGTARRAMADAGGPVTAIAHRHLDEPAEQAIQRRSGWAQPVGAAGSPPAVARAAAGPAAAASADASELEPAAGEAGVVSLSGTAPRAMTDAGSPVTAIAHRHLDEPAEQAIQRRSGWARPVGVVGRPLVVTRLGDRPAILASEDASEHPGQHLSGGAERAAHRQMGLAKSLPSPGYPVIATREDARAETRMSPTAPQTPVLGEEIEPAVPPAGVSTQGSGSNVPLTAMARREAPLSRGAPWGIGVLQRHPGNPEEGMTQVLTRRRALERESAGVSIAQRRLLPARDVPEVPSVADWPAMIQGDRAVASETAVEVENGPMIGRSAPTENTLSMLPLTAGRAPASNVVSRASEPTAMGPTEMLFARTPIDEADMADRAAHSGTGFRSFLPAMPLLRAAQRIPDEIGFGSASPVSDQLAIPGVAARRSAQPAGTQESDTRSQRPLDEPTSVQAAMPKLEGPELERVANEVYAIIERRLMIERESLGL